MTMTGRNHPDYDDDNLTTVTVATDAPEEDLTGPAELALHHQPKQGGNTLDTVAIIDGQS